MKKLNLTCVECPMGCALEVEMEGDKVLSVTGNTCPRGKMYAQNEVVCPMRVLTTTVKTENGKMLSVKTDKPVKKSAMFDLMKVINNVVAKTPAHIGDILIENVSDGANLVATDDVE